MLTEIMGSWMSLKFGKGLNKVGHPTHDVCNQRKDSVPLCKQTNSPLDNCRWFLVRGFDNLSKLIYLISPSDSYSGSFR